MRGITAIWIKSPVMQYCEIISNDNKSKLATVNYWTIIFSRKYLYRF